MTLWLLELRILVSCWQVTLFSIYHHANIYVVSVTYTADTLDVKLIESDPIKASIIASRCCGYSYRDLSSNHQFDLG